MRIHLTCLAFFVVNGRSVPGVDLRECCPDWLRPGVSALTCMNTGKPTPDPGSPFRRRPGCRESVIVYRRFLNPDVSPGPEPVNAGSAASPMLSVGGRGLRTLSRVVIDGVRSDYHSRLPTPRVHLRVTLVTDASPQRPPLAPREASG